MSTKTVTRILTVLVCVLVFVAGYFHIQWKNLEKRYARLQGKYQTLLEKQTKE